MAEGYPIKLVRDKIREQDSVHDGLVQIWATGHTTHVKSLRKKLLEEVGEYLVDGGTGELADILEVVETLAMVAEGCSVDRLRQIQTAKHRERGGFKRGHVLYAYPATEPDLTQQDQPEVAIEHCTTFFDEPEPSTQQSTTGKEDCETCGGIGSIFDPEEVAMGIKLPDRIKCPDCGTGKKRGEQ